MDDDVSRTAIQSLVLIIFSSFIFAGILILRGLCIFAFLRIFQLD